MKNYKFKLTSFHIDNFRVFDKDTKFNLAPITILTGTNSSGKSSFTKALNLLVKSYKKNGLKSLDFMTSNLNLTGFDSIRNTGSGKDEIKFKLEFETRESSYGLNLSFKVCGLSEFSISRNNVVIQSKNTTSSFLQLPESLIDKEKVKHLFYGISDHEIEIICRKILQYLSSDFDCHKNPSAEIFGDLNRDLDFAETHQNAILDSLRNLDYMNSVTTYNSETKKEEESVTYIGANPRLCDVVPEEAIRFGVASIAITDLLNLTALNEFSILEPKLILRFFGSFKFISSLRATQEVIYTERNSPEFFAIISEYLVEGKAEDANRLLTRWVVQEFKLFKLNENEDIKDVFEIRKFQGIGYQVRFLVNGMWTDLASLGYGVTQLFPIILMIATKPNGNFIVEEPEANLHPALQSKLADFFLDITKPTNDLDKMLVKLGTRSIITETHSEYLIRKFQYLVASSSPLDPKDCVIYYFYPPDGVPKNEEQIKKININKDGSLSDNFGDGFTDEATSWKFELLKINNIQKN